MNRLQICQAVHRKLRVASQLPGTGPSTTLAQEGILFEIVSSVDDAYREIQTEHQDWNFRHKRSTLALSAATRSYSRATIQAQIADYDRLIQIYPDGSRGFLLHTTATGVSDQGYCWYYLYQDWRGYVDRGTAVSGRPSRFTEHPDGTLEFDPTPDAGYTITLDYQRTLHTFSGDSDEPLWHDDYHFALVWRAVLEFAKVRPLDINLRQEAQASYDDMLGKMQGRYRPELTFDGTLFWGSDP